jgi:hypothetical protein
MTTENWYKKIKVECNLDQLLIFARKQMINNKWVGNNTYELIDQNSKYFECNLNDITDQNIQNMISYIEFEYKIPLRHNNSYLSIWEFGEGDRLPPHTDPDISQSASVVLNLIGRFKLNLHNNNNDNIIDSFQYGPGEGIILNNTMYRHSGECLDGYRLSLLLSVDPKFNIKDWFIYHE